jgi:hypothetical protein
MVYWLIAGNKKTKANESFLPGNYFRILAFDVIVIFEQVNRRDTTVDE